MNRVKRNASFIRLFWEPAFTISQLRFILKTATRDQVLTLAEIFVNVLKGQFNLSPVQLTELSKYKNILRKLGHQSRSDWKYRRQYMSHVAGSIVKILTILRKRLTQLLT